MEFPEPLDKYKLVGNSSANCINLLVRSFPLGSINLANTSVSSKSLCEKSTSSIGDPCTCKM